MTVPFQREQLTKQSKQVFYKCREHSKRRNDKSLHTRQNLGLLRIYDSNFRKGSIFLLAPSSLNSENMKQAIGYSLFVLSFITWGAIAVVPFFGCIDRDGYGLHYRSCNHWRNCIFLKHGFAWERIFIENKKFLGQVEYFSKATGLTSLHLPMHSHSNRLTPTTPTETLLIY